MLTTIPQTLFNPGAVVIENGEALWILDNDDWDNSTQIVRPGQPTQFGPKLFQDNWYEGCAAALGNGSVAATGGWDGHSTSSPQLRVYNSSTQQWEVRADMKHGRQFHSCATVLLCTTDDDRDGLIFGASGSSPIGDTITSVMVAGGEEFHYF